MTNQKDPSCVMVIFGAGGDLAARKLMPALFNLSRAGHLPEKFAVVGSGRSELSSEAFQEKIFEALKEQSPQADWDEGSARKFVTRLQYYVADSTAPDAYPAFKAFLEKIAAQKGASQNILFYLATPPSLFGVIPKYLGGVGLLSETNGWRRVVIEKPFGVDLRSAQALNHGLREVMAESQIYRIDHYLGKETVQNLLVLRLANGIFEPTWNRQYIDSVQITVAETLGVESRGGYYDHSGAFRDMVPNHLFQVLSMIAMEPPNSFSADDVRDEKVKVLRAIKRLTAQDVPNQVVRAQYEGYRSEKGVAPQSRTETFAALKLEIDNWRWAGVPFYLRTGKKLARRLTEVCIQFKNVPFQIFRDTPCGEMTSNQLILGIQPEEKISLCFQVKKPGPDVELAPVSLDFNYKAAFGKIPETGYETLIYDCMRGDATLFQRADQVEAAWRVVQPILEVWRNSSPDQSLPTYASGSWGPEAADELVLSDGRNWREVEPEPLPARKKAA